MSSLYSNKKILDAVALTGNQASEAQDIPGTGYAIHNVWSAGATGTIIVEVSCDGTNYDDVDSEAIAGSAGNKMVSVPAAHYPFVRVRYAFTSGTGTLTSYFASKI